MQAFEEDNSPGDNYDTYRLNPEYQSRVKFLIPTFERITTSAAQSAAARENTTHILFID